MERNVADIPEMFSEMMILMKMQGVEQQSRNGTVLSLPEPLTITVHHPKRRVMHDPIRKANPFFHVMEFVWMMAGSRDPEWIKQFNARFIEYADENNAYHIPLIHGAYGHRWVHHFGRNQILLAIQMLRNNPDTRRVVLSMWDGGVDLGTNHADLPCNTHIYLRIINGRLDFTVCNRSNDVIWGMTGANAVHMTLLQELMAEAIEVEVGVYRVFTNNAHVYKDLPNVGKMLDTMNPVWSGTYTEPLPLLGDSSMQDFLQECSNFVNGDSHFKNKWLNDTAKPMRDMYLSRKEDPRRTKNLDLYLDLCGEVRDPTWYEGCKQWLRLKSQ